MRVGPFRSRAGVPYPHAYASPEQIAAATPEQKKNLYLFNCAQRAHANWDENFPPTLVALLTAGLYSPKWASVAGATWIVNRIVYAVGYTMKSKTEGKGRLYGELMWPAQLALVVMTGLWGWDLVKN